MLLLQGPLLIRIAPLQELLPLFIYIYVYVFESNLDMNIKQRKYNSFKIDRIYYYTFVYELQVNNLQIFEG